MAILIKLKHVSVADFRCNHETQYKRLPAKVRRTFKRGDAVCFRNSADRIVRFVWVKGPTARRTDGAELAATMMLEIRLPQHRRWDPAMLPDYAHDAGLEIIGGKLLTDRLKPFARGRLLVTKMMPKGARKATRHSKGKRTMRRAA